MRSPVPFSATETASVGNPGHSRALLVSVTMSAIVAFSRLRSVESRTGVTKQPRAVLGGS
jgi:hypothetical protein